MQIGVRHSAKVSESGHLPTKQNTKLPKIHAENRDPMIMHLHISANLYFSCMLFLLPLLLSAVYCSQILSNQDISLTIYNGGYGIIKDVRNISLDPLESYLSVDDVAATIQS